MESYYELDQETKDRILKLVETCKELHLGNVSFDYYETPRDPAVDFYISQRKDDWELVVSSHYESHRDVYRITDGIIKYDFSEKEEE